MPKAGGVGGYRWGADRKRALLDRESAPAPRTDGDPLVRQAAVRGDPIQSGLSRRTHHIPAGARGVSRTPHPVIPALAPRRPRTGADADEPPRYGVSPWSVPSPAKASTFPPAPDLGEADVVVIGGGLTGLLTAWGLKAAGRGVVLLDAGAPRCRRQPPASGLTGLLATSDYRALGGDARTPRSPAR